MDLEESKKEGLAKRLPGVFEEREDSVNELEEALPDVSVRFANRSVVPDVFIREFDVATEVITQKGGYRDGEISLEEPEDIRPAIDHSLDEAFYWFFFSLASKRI